MNNKIEVLSGSLYRLLAESSRRSSSLHGQFLQLRRNSLQDIKTLLELQIRSGSPSGSPSARMPASPPIFDSRQLDAFGTGKISECLGPAFAIYDQRRIPRIPNGELKMMSRIVQIEGEPRSFHKPTSLTAEYDVPADAWYLRDNAYPDLPVSVLMEIALQPCGFLSAYLDTYAVVPHESFFFRNLDGSARLVSRIDPRGKTIVTRARLITSVVSGGSVIQKYDFVLSCEGRPIYQGESTFGYFSTESMANQVGLDGGKSPAPWVTNTAVERVPVQRWTNPLPGQPDLRLSRGKMSFLDEVSLSRTGGQFGHGYIYARRPVNPGDWFYPYHFYQDPVMPGSLGVEAIQQAVQTYVLETGLGRGLRSPRFGLPTGLDMHWRYRGQITPQHKQMELEVHLNAPERREGSTVLAGEASLWVDGLRIYSIKNAAVAILEG